MGRWIWDVRAASEKTEFVYFRKICVLQNVMEHFSLFVSADTRYKLFINGCCAGFGPAKSNGAVWYKDRIDIGPYIRPGENVIAAEILHYPAGTTEGNSSLYRTYTPGFYIEGITGSEFDTDDSYYVYTAKERKIVPENPFFAPLMIYEKCQENHGIHGWHFGEYRDSDKKWNMAYVYEEAELDPRLLSQYMIERPIPLCTQRDRCFQGIVSCGKETAKEEWEPVLKGTNNRTIPPQTTTYVELDAGELACGHLMLSVIGGQGSRIEILQAESYVLKAPAVPESFEDLPIKGDRSDHRNGFLHGYSDVYYVDGTGNEACPECYEPFWIRTFRYIRLMVTTKDQPLVIRDLHYRETGYPLEVKYTPEFTDVEKKKIWEMSLRTLKRCMHDTYMDCPYYEQIQYAMDARSEILFTYAVSGDDRLARLCMEAFRTSARPDGLTCCSAPDIRKIVIPGFSIFYIGMLYDHRVHFEDREFLLPHLDTVRGILAFFHTHLDKRGIVGKIGTINGNGKFWSFIDWTKEWMDTTGMPPAGLQGPITMESLYYLYGLIMAKELFSFLNKEQEAEDCERKAVALRIALRRFCTDQNGVMTDGPGIAQYSQHAQVFAVLTDVLSIQEGKRILQDTLANRDKYAQCSVASMFYLFRAMEKCGIYEQTETLWDLWRKMLQLNLTTCPEDMIRDRSDCHAWGALALYEMADPAYKKSL